MHRTFLTLAAVLGALAVASGAFGAHALTGRLSSLADGARRLSWWQTASQYHLAHALALALTAGLVGERPWGKIACVAFTLGIVVFSGTLYTMTLTGSPWLGRVTPVGGLALIVGWVALAVAALKLG